MCVCQNASQEDSAQDDRGLLARVWSAFRLYVIQGTMDTLRTIGRRRPHHMRALIAVQLLQYAFSFVVFQYLYLLYLYMLQ